MTTDKLFLLFGCAITGSAVALGAFGAHGLRKSLSTEMLSVYQTGVLYQLIHGVALLGVGLALHHYDHSSINWGGYLLIIGTFLFSGSLYVLSVSSIRYVGIVTPIGGLAYIVGWILLFTGILRSG